jgi:uncharacterized CHY-type Zn-finger protein
VENVLVKKGTWNPLNEKKKGYSIRYFVCPNCHEKNEIHPWHWHTRSFLSGVDKIVKCHWCKEKFTIPAEKAKRLWAQTQ